MPPHPALFVKKKVYDKYGLFKTNYEISADYELMLRFFYKNHVSVKHEPYVFVKMRLGGNSNGSVGKRFRSLKEDRRAWMENGLDPLFYTIPMKPMSKLLQYF